MARKQKPRKAFPAKGSGVQTTLDRIGANLKSELAALKATAIATGMHPTKINAERKAIYARAHDAEQTVAATEILASFDRSKQALEKRASTKNKPPIGQVAPYKYKALVRDWVLKKRDEHTEMLSRHLQPGGESNPENMKIYEEIARLQQPRKQVSMKSFAKPGLPAKGRLYVKDAYGRFVGLRSPQYFSETERVLRGKMPVLYQLQPKLTDAFRQPKKKRRASDWRPSE